MVQFTEKFFDEICGKARPFLVWCSLICLFALTLRAERLPIKTYTIADGLLRDVVNKIRQDSRGFLWFCTVEGASRFDGYGFTNFTTDDGLPDRHVNDFLETKKGTYLIATDAGIAKLNPKGLRASLQSPLFSVYLPDNPNAGKIHVLLEDESGTTWVGTSGGLFRLVENGNHLAFEDVNLDGTRHGEASLVIVSLLKDKRGALWIGTQASGLFRLAVNGQVDHYSTANHLPSNNVTALAEDKNGRIWAGMGPDDKNFGGLSALADDPQGDQQIVGQNYTVNDGLPSDRVESLYQASDGRMWIGTTGGLCLWQTATVNRSVRSIKKIAVCAIPKRGVSLKTRTVIYGRERAAV